LTDPEPAGDADATPLPSEGDEAASQEPEGTSSESEAPVRPPVPQFKISTFIYIFLFLLGIWMLFDTSTRNAVASLFGLVLQPLFGFHGQWLLLTMFFAACTEMLLTAVAYNWATDWVKVARVQAMQKSFRPIQMKAMRSGKKDRMDALKPQQAELTKLSGEVSMAQLKGMAVTWFLVISIYTWVGLFIAATATADPSYVVVNLGLFSIKLTSTIGNYIPYWIVLFTLYTVPLSLVFRRLLKNYTLRKYSRSREAAREGGAAQGAA
jgi:uncharacterized membrane protein (DUF106 family)